MSVINYDQGGKITINLLGRGLEIPTVLKAVGMMLIVVSPLIAPSFTHVLTTALIFVVFAIGLDFVWGYGGILTFGQAVFFGLGAYITGKALTESWFILPDFTILLFATAVPAVLGIVLSGVLFYQRMDALNFGVITLIFAAMAEQIATSWTSVTGGSNGIVAIPSLSFGFEMNSLQYFYFALIIAVSAYTVTYMIIQSRFGTALVSIRENEKKARSLGYNIEIYKTLAFGIGCALAGFSGGLYATHVGFISPSVLGFILSTQAIIWVLIGGKGTLTGAFIGPIIILSVERILADALLGSWRLIIGFVLVIMILLLPGGIVSLYDRFEKKLHVLIDDEEEVIVSDS